MPTERVRLPAVDPDPVAIVELKVEGPWHLYCYCNISYSYYIIVNKTYWIRTASYTAEIVTVPTESVAAVILPQRTCPIETVSWVYITCSNNIIGTKLIWSSDDFISSPMLLANWLSLAPVLYLLLLNYYYRNLFGLNCNTAVTTLSYLATESAPAVNIPETVNVSFIDVFHRCIRC